MLKLLAPLALVPLTFFNAVEDPPVCPTTCTPEFSVLTFAGSGWTVTPSTSLGIGHGTEYCENCMPCKSGMSFSFDGGIFNMNSWKSHTDNGDSSGDGHTAGWIRVESGCDETNVNVFTGWDVAGDGTATPGVIVDLYCVCAGV